MSTEKPHKISHKYIYYCLLPTYLKPFEPTHSTLNYEGGSRIIWFLYTAIRILTILSLFTILDYNIIKKYVEKRFIYIFR